MAEVLVTLIDGVVDYCTIGDVLVVVVDLDHYKEHVGFPSDVNRDIAAVAELSPEMPWSNDIIQRLRVIRSATVEAIRSGPVPPEEVNED